jgi:hypothetical protein
MMVINFVLTFVNTAVMILLLNANFSESDTPWIKYTFSVGKETDFS